MNLKEKAKEIRSLVADLHKQDKNWKWKVKKMSQHSVTLYWEYLEYMGAQSDAFTIDYDVELEFFVVYDEKGEFIDWDLEDVDSIEGTIKSVFYYARSRY